MKNALLAALLAALPAALRAADVIVPWFGVPQAETVDTIEYAASRGDRVTIDGKPTVPTAENATAVPATTFRQEDWNDIGNWIAFPVSVSVPETDPDTGELVKYLNRRVNRPETLAKILREHNQPIPPRPWPGYTLSARKSCALGTGSHVYGADCACVVCGERRDHSFAVTEDGACARCQNRLDGWEFDGAGNKVATGEALDAVCGAKIPRDLAGGDDLALHGGFRNEPTESEKYNCSCECGHFAKAANPLAHDFESDESSSWGQTDPNGDVDKAQHWRCATCQRCGEATSWTAEDHRLAADAEGRADGDSTYVDLDAHHAPGVCADCGYKGDIREAHDRDEDCFCAACQTSCHDWQIFICGYNSGSIYHCAYCGKYAHNPYDPKYYGDRFEIIPAEAAHHFGDEIPLGDATPPNINRDTHHRCYCGALYEEHTFTATTQDGTVKFDHCWVCGFERESEDSTKHRDATCAKLGVANEWHTGDRSGHDPTKPCPDHPASTFESVLPAVANPDDPDDTAFATNNWMGRPAAGFCLFLAKGAPLVVMSIGGSDPARSGVFTGEEVSSWMFNHLDGFVSDYSEGIAETGVGSTVELDYRVNGVSRTVVDAFTGERRETILFPSEVVYKGEVRLDKSKKPYIEWTSLSDR